MEPERLEFLNRFDKLYRVLINSLKEKKINERDFYLLIIAKARDMDRERREKKGKLKGGLLKKEKKSN